MANTKDRGKVAAEHTLRLDAGSARFGGSAFLSESALSVFRPHRILSLAKATGMSALVLERVVVYTRSTHAPTYPPGPDNLPRMRRWVTAALLALAGCAPGFGPFVLPSVEGSLIDRDSREPIAGAEIVQVYRGAGTAGADQPVVLSRWTRTDREGNFFFAKKVTSSPRVWFGKAYGPRYDFYHPAYGLVRGPSTDASRVLLQGSLDQAKQRRMDLQVFCSSTADDPGSRHLQTVACPDRAVR